MSRKGLLAAALALLVAFILILVLRSGQRVQTPVEATNVVAEAGTPSTESPAERQIPPSNLASGGAHGEELLGPTGPTNYSSGATQEAVRAFSNLMQGWAEQVHGPIEFYGKVVDENGQPVEGAEIEFVWMHVYPEGSFKTNAVSDAAGLFLLRGVKGAKLGVHVSKAGYRLIRSLNQESFGYSSAPGFEPFHPDPNNPVTFHLRKGE